MNEGGYLIEFSSADSAPQVLNQFRLVPEMKCRGGITLLIRGRRRAEGLKKGGERVLLQMLGSRRQPAMPSITLVARRPWRRSQLASWPER